MSIGFLKYLYTMFKKYCNIENNVVAPALSSKVMYGLRGTIQDELKYSSFIAKFKRYPIGYLLNSLFPYT